MDHTSSSYRRLESAVDDDIRGSFESIDIEKSGSIKEENLKDKQRNKLTVDVFQLNEMEVESGNNTPDSRHKDKRAGILSRKLHDIRIFVIVVCFYILAFVMVEMYIMAVLTTMEKRFGFRSRSSGALMSAKEVAYVCFVTFSSHFGNKWHRPRFLSIMAILGAAGSFISALPHFLYDSPFHVLRNTSGIIQKETELVCLPNNSQTNYKNNSEGCDDSVASHNEGAYVLFQVSNVLIGIAMSPMIALTTTYVDDAAGPRNTAFYFGMLNKEISFVLKYNCSLLHFDCALKNYLADIAQNCPITIGL